MKVIRLMKGNYLINVHGKQYQVIQNWHNTEWKLFELIDGEQVWCETFNTKTDAIHWLK